MLLGIGACLGSVFCFIEDVSGFVLGCVSLFSVIGVLSGCLAAHLQKQGTVDTSPACLADPHVDGCLSSLAGWLAGFDCKTLPFLE